MELIRLDGGMRMGFGSECFRFVDASLSPGYHMVLSDWGRRGGMSR